MEYDQGYVRIAEDEYGELLQMLKTTETDKNKLARELKTAKKNIEIIKMNMETQAAINKVITGEKQKQEMYIRLLLQSCPDPLFIFDENMKFLLGTESTKDIIGIDDISILQGRELDSIIDRYRPPVFTEEIIHLIKSIITGQGKDTLEKTLEISTEEYRYEVNILSFNKEDGGFAGVLILVHDITEIIRSKEIAERASMAKGDFLSQMSHEMRTPMNAIIGMTNIAKSSKESEKVDYCLEKIESASRHLLGVINDILDISKIEANKFELSYDAFNFEKMLVSVTNVINFRVEEKKQNFIINLDESIPETIVGDEFRLMQVITNLLSNAVKFTPDGGSITLSAKKLPIQKGKPLLQIEVTDTGIGISKEQQLHLFKSFQQAESGTARKYGGTGLGLAISKRIVDLMGGKIWIESELGVGSKFAFTIEYETGKAKRQTELNLLKDDIGINECTRPAENVEPDADQPDIGIINDYNEHTILIAEDIDVNREIIAAVLEETGISIDFAENGYNAVSLFKENPCRYSLILMDIQMPEMDGYEATRIIRAIDSDEARSIPIVAMTANVFKEDVEKCLDAGMNSHLGKPIEITELYSMLKLYLVTDPTSRMTSAG